MEREGLLSIDGSFGEGGGAILRVALALSAILKKPVEIFNIRKGRKEPGLKLQHLLTVKNAAKLCDAFLEGAELGSTKIRFWPKEIVSKRLEIKIETAGSITLALQGLLPICFFAPSLVEIFFEGGGTDVPFSPPIDYYRFLFLKILEKMGGKVEIEIQKRGFYPAGGAKVKVKVFPSRFKGISISQRGKLKRIFLYSVASFHLKEKKVAERQILGAKEILKNLKVEIEEKKEYANTISPGSVFCLIGEFENTILGFDALGKIGKRAEEIGKEVCQKFLSYSKIEDVLDEHALDQILIYMALAKGESKIKTSFLSSHAKTNIFVIEKFLGKKFEFEGSILKCSGSA